MSYIKFLFRADNTNVGDWWCPPWKFFPFKPGTVNDIADVNCKITNTDILIVGGGGLGSEHFRQDLARLRASKPKVSIVWGAGVDSVVKPGEILSYGRYDLHGDYFDFFDEKGVRIFSEKKGYKYVPCASCMSNLFFKYRDTKPTAMVGAYNHKRAPLFADGNSHSIPVSDNSGNDLESKIKFLSSFEYIITNTYHGVYWATLLGRKVVCVPFKSGLFSFKFAPSYIYDAKITDEILHQAVAYDDALEDSRNINVGYYSYLADKYDIV